MSVPYDDYSRNSPTRTLSLTGAILLGVSVTDNHTCVLSLAQLVIMTRLLRYFSSPLDINCIDVGH
jgi:hypothetical protein